MLKQDAAKSNLSIKVSLLWASLVVLWLRTRLPMQGTRVRALVLEDPTCRGATKPVCHNYWACALEPVSHNYWARVPQLLSLCATTTEPVCHNYWARVPQLLSPCATTTEPMCLEPTHCNEVQCPPSPQLEKARVQQQRPNAARRKKKKLACFSSLLLPAFFLSSC